MAFIPGYALSDTCGPGGCPGEVEDEKAGENFLKDEVRLLRVKMDEANGIFQAAGGSLNPPMHGVEASRDGGREVFRIQAGDEEYSIAVFCFNTDDLERKGSKTSAFRLQIIEGHLGWDAVMGGWNRSAERRQAVNR